jgi:hypothetical protein
VCFAAAAYNTVLQELRHLRLQLDTVACWKKNATPTPATRGEEAWLTLARMGEIHKFESMTGSPAVLTPAELNAMPCRFEEEMVSYLLPFLWDALFPPEAQVLPRVLFTSERDNWLYHPTEERANRKSLLKPDFFVTFLPFFTPSAVDAGNKVDGATNKTRYGTSHSILLRYETAGLVGSATVRVGLKCGPFGTLCNYHAHIPGVCRGVVFNEKEFWLYKTCNGDPISVLTDVHWDQPGSAIALRNFFAASPKGDLICALEHFIVTVGNITLDAGAFLGAGATGAVFKCTSSGQEMALKVVLFDEARCDDTAFAREVQTLSDLHAKKAPVIYPQQVTIHSRAEDGVPPYGAYTMTPVGKRLCATKTNCRAMFKSLNEVHKLGGVHGDARLANCIFVEGKGFLWIDFLKGLPSLVLAAARGAHENKARADMQRLCNSILAQKGVTFVFEYEMVAGYNIDSGLDDIVNLLIERAFHD